MSKQPIGPREQALRDMRKRMAESPPGTVGATITRLTVTEINLPRTTGKKPVKRKAKRRAKR